MNKRPAQPCAGEGSTHELSGCQSQEEAPAVRARARVRSPTRRTRAQNDSVRINATPNTQRQEVHRWRQRRSLRYHEAPTAHRQELFPTAPGWHFGGHPLGDRPWSQSSQVQTPAVPYLGQLEIRALLSPAGRCTWRGSLAAGARCARSAQAAGMCQPDSAERQCLIRTVIKDISTFYHFLSIYPKNSWHNQYVCPTCPTASFG